MCVKSHLNTRTDTDTERQVKGVFAQPVIKVGSRSIAVELWQAAGR